MSEYTKSIVKESTHFSMIGKAHTYIVPDEGNITKQTATKLMRYGGDRFDDAGIDVNNMTCEIEYNTTSEYYSVSFTNREGTRFSVHGILYDEKTDVSRLYAVFGIPTSIIIDRDGIIQYRGTILPANVNQLIDTLLAPSS